MRVVEARETMRGGHLMVRGSEERRTEGWSEVREERSDDRVVYSTTINILPLVASLIAGSSLSPPPPARLSLTVKVRLERLERSDSKSIYCLPIS
jgi:hypothetical protein